MDGLITDNLDFIDGNTDSPLPYHVHNGIDSPQADFNDLTGTLALEYDNGNATGTATIDWMRGVRQYITLTGNTTLTFINPPLIHNMILHVAGAYTPTFPGTVRWTAGTTPTATATAGKKDIYTFIYSGKESLYDGLQSPNYSIT